MKKVFFLLAILLILFASISVFLYWKLTMYSNFFGIESFDKAASFNYYQSYIFDTQSNNFILSSDYTRLTMSNSQHTINLDLKNFTLDNVKLFFSTWDSAQGQERIKIFAPKSCQYFEIKLPYKPNIAYSNIDNMLNGLIGNDNVLPFSCLNSLYGNQIKEIY